MHPARDLHIHAHVDLQKRIEATVAAVPHFPRCALGEPRRVVLDSVCERVDVGREGCRGACVYAGYKVERTEL